LSTKHDPPLQKDADGQYGRRSRDAEINLCIGQFTVLNKSGLDLDRVGKNAVTQSNTKADGRENEGKKVLG
jgi:hypothetical protein